MPSGDHPPLLQQKSGNIFLEEGKTLISGLGDARHSCGQESFIKKKRKLIYMHYMLRHQHFPSSSFSGPQHPKALTLEVKGWKSLLWGIENNLKLLTQSK